MRGRSPITPLDGVQLRSTWVTTEMAVPSKTLIQPLPLLRGVVPSLLRGIISPAGVSVTWVTRRGRVCECRGRAVANSNARSKDAVAIFFIISISPQTNDLGQSLRWRRMVSFILKIDGAGQISINNILRSGAGARRPVITID